MSELTQKKPFRLREPEVIFPETALKGKADHFKGFIIDSSTLPESSDQFKAYLEESLKVWQESRVRGLWLKIPIEKSAFIPIAVENQFVFHHAKRDYVMLTRWLPKSTNTLPNYASFFVGVGGFVVNDKEEVLVIQEKNGPIKGFWKIPGGAVDPGEELSDAAMREVFEETGIKTEFQSLLCFRQTNGYNFGLSDLYFVCRLKPLTLDITKQEREIKECKWMPASEFFNLPFYQGLYKKIIQIEEENYKGEYAGWRIESLPIGFRPGNNTIYHGTGPTNLSHL